MSAHGGVLTVARPKARRWRAGSAALLAAIVVLLGIVGLGIAAVTSHPALSADAGGLARLQLPFGGGSVRTLSVTGGREQGLVPVRMRGDAIWPTGRIPAGERLTIVATVARPGWISWLTGSSEQVRMTVRAPSSRLQSHFVTVRHGHPLTLHFAAPVQEVAWGSSASRLTRHVLAQPVTQYTLRPPGIAGTIAVAAAPRPWETAQPELVSYFPQGAAATAVASPAPGSSISPSAPITLTFSKPVAQALGSHMPPVSPATAGTWHTMNAHTIRFIPSGYGYGLGAHVTVALPSGVRLLGGGGHGANPIGAWSVPAGSTLRLQQLLAMTGYLPFHFRYAGPGATPTLAGEVQAAIHPPAGTFAWRYGNVPSALRSDWSPGSDGVMTRGAVMAFENDHGLTPDGVAGPAVWQALIAAALKGQRSSFGYTYVMVSESSPETIHVWHNGQIVVSGLVNTGVAAAPTATGTYPVFEHIPVTTMSGTNPDGSHYSDPGIPWVSYFNGGDALHGFIRASYGFPQSVGCVEMPFARAHAVYPYTPIGTLVNVT